MDPLCATGASAVYAPGFGMVRTRRHPHCLRHLISQPLKRTDPCIATEAAVLGAPFLQRGKKAIDFLPSGTHLSSQDNVSLLIRHARGQITLALVDSDKKHVGFSRTRSSVLAIPHGYAVPRILQENAFS